MKTITGNFMFLFFRSQVPDSKLRSQNVEDEINHVHVFSNLLTDRGKWFTELSRD